MKVQLSKPFYDWDCNMRPAFGPDGERVTYEWPDDVPIPDMTTILHSDGTKEVYTRSGAAAPVPKPIPVMEEVETFSEMNKTVPLEPGVSRKK